MTIPHLLALVAAAGLALAACGGNDEREPSAPTPRELDVPTANLAPPARDEQTRSGRRLVARAGCLACHRLGRAGNDGPGPELSSIGERIPASAIARSLVAPRAPMPSYAGLPREDRAAIVAYLVTLRGPDRGGSVRGSNERR